MKPLKSLAVAVGGLCAAAHGKEVHNPEASGMAMMRLNASVLSDNAQLAHANKADTGAQRIFGGSVWKQLAHDFRLGEVNSNLVRSHENKFANNRAYFNRTLERSKPYMFHITNEVKKRGMPAEIALLPFIESAYVTKARSHVGASGLWQFMPATGRHYGLEQTPLYDGRHDVYASTNAALNYLQYLHGLFGDWSLALAAYNWGEGNLTRAIRRAQASGLPPTYENLRMPSETRNYVPKLLAVRNLVRNPQSFGLQLPDIQHSPYFQAVNVDAPMDVMAAAHLANIPESEFLALNPAFKTPVFIPKHGRKMLLPVAAVKTFENNYRNTDTRALLSWDVYTPDYTTTLSDIAAKTNTPVGELRRLNGINGNRVSAGKSILVSRNNSLNNNQNITLNFAKADNDPVPDTYVEQAPVLTAADTAAAAPAVAQNTPAQKQANFINFVENGAVNDPIVEAAARGAAAVATSAPAKPATAQTAGKAASSFDFTAAAKADKAAAANAAAETAKSVAEKHADKAVQVASEHFAFADVTSGAASAPAADTVAETFADESVRAASEPAAAAPFADDPLMALAKQRSQALQAARSAVSQANAQAERAEAARIAKEAARAKARAAAERAARIAEAKEAKRREQERLRAEKLKQAQQLASIRQAREAGDPVAQAIRASATIQQHNGTHKVREGDTLYNIAQRYNINVADLISANGIRNNHIRIGQVLRISGSKKATSRNPLSKVSGNAASTGRSTTPASYTVRKGDTLHSIATRYNLNINEIKRLNNGTSNLKTGQTIRLISS